MNSQLPTQFSWYKSMHEQPIVAVHDPFVGIYCLGFRSRVAQWKRAGPITQRSVDRNHALLKVFSHLSNTLAFKIYPGRTLQFRALSFSRCSQCSGINYIINRQLTTQLIEYKRIINMAQPSYWWTTCHQLERNIPTLKHQLHIALFSSELHMKLWIFLETHEYAIASQNVIS